MLPTVAVVGRPNVGKSTLFNRLVGRRLALLDARAGVLPDDRAFADELRRAGKPVIVVANKSESKAGEAGYYEAFELGLGEPVSVSAEHNEGMADLYDALREALAVEPEESEAEPSEGETAEAEEARARPIRVAVVGRPNSGKSTLINALIGEDRLVTGPEAGITRDSIAVDFEHSGRRFELFDTAGLRRRGRVDDKLEQLSVADALRAIRFAEV